MGARLCSIFYPGLGSKDVCRRGRTADTVLRIGTMGISGEDRTEEAQTALRPIVGLTANLPKDILETIVVEAIYKHRFLRDIAELRHADSRRVAESDGRRTAYIKAMIDVHAQQTVLSTLLGVLGYVPTMPAD